MAGFHPHDPTRPGRSCKEADPYELRLYVAGLTSRSLRAIKAVKSTCEHFLEDRYELKIINIYDSPKLAKDEQIVAAPTLIKTHPPPLRRIIGDMSHEDKLLAGLSLRTKRHE